MSRADRIAIVVALALFSAGPARGQQAASSRATAEAGRAHSFEISVGGGLLAPQGLGTSTANMTSNNETGTPFKYFAVTGTRAAAPAFRGGIGYNLTSMFTVEGGILIGRSNVRGSVSGDAEGASTPVLTERMTQYFVDASLVAHLRQAAFAGGAGVPFLEAGAGYLRQLHEGNSATNTGQIYHFGGGVTYMFSTGRRRSRVSGLGIRVDGRVYLPRKEYSFTSPQQVFAAVNGSLVVAF